MRIARFLTLTALAGAMAIAGCSKKATGPEVPLGYVPADTPYLFANLEPTPQAVIDAWREKFASIGPMYDQMLTDALAEIEAKGSNELADRVAKAVLQEIQGKISFDGMRSLGLDPRLRWAFYGVGLVPVMRMELEDPKAFEAFIGRVEGRVGDQLPKGKVGDQPYWRLGKSDGKLHGVMAITGDDLVLTAMPANASEDLIQRLLGLTLPAQTIGDGFGDWNSKRRFLSYGSGYVDTVRVATALIDEKSGIEREFLQALEIKEQPTSPECRTEMLALAAKVPMISFGYTQLEPTLMDMRLVLETEPAIAKAFAGLAAPVPSMGQAQDAVLDFGLSLDLMKLSTFATEQADKVSADPFKCPELASLNADMEKLRTQFNNPMLFATAPVFRGFYAALTRFEQGAGGAPPVVTGKIALASDNPQALIAMAQNFVPQIAQLDLKPGAGPVPLPPELAPPMLPPTHVLMGDKVIGLALGEGEEADLATFVAAAPASPPPLLTMGYSGTFFISLAESMQANLAALPDEERAKTEHSVALIREIYGKVLDRVDMRLVATDSGLELRESVRLK
jgi:hypothetical protein